jgi:Asp-tRNA(Asn)/Glu-tRNA(Gln) amidotransferase A subunit family amidase
MAGLPGISVPCGLSEGLPVGLQFIGPAWSELELFRLARAFEGLTAGDTWRGQEPSQLDLADDPTTLSPRARVAARSAA